MKKKKIGSTAPKTIKTWALGEVFENPYLGNKTTEILSADGNRIGFIWTHTDGKIVVSPHLGFYVWFAEGGADWTLQSGADWLAKHRPD